jgi:hypothetical protein
VRAKKRIHKRTRQGMAFVTSWPSWYRLSTSNQQHKRVDVNGIVRYDRHPGVHGITLTLPEFAYRITTILTSAGITGVGIGILIYKIIGG